VYEAHQRSKHHTFLVSLFSALEQRRDFTAASLLFSVSSILPQLFVLGLTIKRFHSGLRAGWGRIPIVYRLVRDEIILVSIICEFRRKRRVYYRSFRSLKFVVEGLKLNWFLFFISNLLQNAFPRFSGLDHIGSIPYDRQDCVWVHRLLVRSNAYPAPFSLSHATASYLFPHKTAAGYYQ
jgi:hypothetical protein